MAKLSSLCAAMLTAGVLQMLLPASAAENTHDAAALTGTMQSINDELSDQRAAIGALKAEIAALSDENTRLSNSLLKEIKGMRRQNQSVYDALDRMQMLKNKNGTNASDQPLRNYEVQTPDGKMIFGGTELFYVKEANATLEARVDTGATISSISADNITEFERKGKKWLRFTLTANDRSIQVEAPFVRYSDTRQSTKDVTTRRVVVRLNVRIGNYATDSEFSLADRSRMRYPLLIGRSLIQDIAVVDVARDHIQPRADQDGLILIDRDQYLKLKKAGKNPNAEYDKKQAAKSEKIATPSDAGPNLGTESEKVLPEVVHKLSEKEKDNQK